MGGREKGKLLGPKRKRESSLRPPKTKKEKPQDHRKPNGKREKGKGRHTEFEIQFH